MNIKLTTYAPHDKYNKYNNHINFGGSLCIQDFITNFPGKPAKRSSIADRIASDWKFDLICAKNDKERKTEHAIK